MRKQATERLGETRRRHSVEADLDNEDEGILVTAEKRRRKSNFDVMKIIEESLAAKIEQQEESNWLRAREIALMENQIASQQQFQQNALNQQQQFQQQQQQVTFCTSNLFTHIIWYILYLKIYCIFIVSFFKKE